MDDEELTIKVGSREFKTRLSNIANYPDSTLYKSYVFDKDAFGQIFWDRDEHAFACLLEFYRTGRLLPPSSMPIDHLARELSFWGFEMDMGLGNRICHEDLFPKHVEEKKQNVILPPLGISLRATDPGCHIVLLCLSWSAISRMKCVWEAAQLGLRDIRIYWKCRIPQSGLSIHAGLLKNHAAFLSALANMDRCSIKFYPSVSVNTIQSEARRQDVITRGTLSFDGYQGQTVHALKMMATVSRQGQRLVFSAVDGMLKTSFVHLGFRIDIYANGRYLWWDICLEDQEPFEEVDPSRLTNTKGFLLEVKIVHRTTLLNAFFIPSSCSRCEVISGDNFYSQTYTLPKPTPNEWYFQQNRSRYIKEIQLDYPYLDTDAQEIVILFEDRNDASFSYTKRETSYLAEHEAEQYDKLEVSW